MNIFDILGDILLKKGGRLDEDPEFRKIFSGFMLCRYLSMRECLLKYAELLNRYQTSLEPEQLYRMAYNIVPKQKSAFIKYLKKAKKKKKSDDSSEDEDELDD